jgi:hypothetical protein
MKRLLPVSLTKLQVLDEDSFLLLHKQVSDAPAELLKPSGGLEEFSVLRERLRLSLIESDYLFDDSAQLALPQSKSWADDGNRDRRNCDVIFAALPGLSAIQATDERLWTTLSWVNFEEYANARWPISGQSSRNPGKGIKDHRFASTARGRWRDNAISRLWWMAYYAHTVDDLDPRTVLNVLCFDADLVASFLGRPWTANNRRISKFLIVELDRHYLNRDAPKYSRGAFRSTLMELDLRAGKTIFSALDDQILQTLVHDVFVTHHRES